MTNHPAVLKLIITLFSRLQESISCALYSRDAFVVSHEAVDLGDYERHLNSTLVICRAKTDVTSGLYECVVNRTEDNLFNITRVWSANVRLSPVGKSSVKL